MAILRVALAVSVLPLVILLVLPVLLLLVPFWLVASLARSIRPLCEPRVVRWREIIQFDPNLGWRPRPNLDVWCLEERDDVFRIVTDDLGWAGRGTLESAHVIVLGDSFAFGYGVDTPATFAHALRAPSIKGIGAPGYNLVQEVLALEQLAPAFRGKLVVWWIYVGNDLYDNLSPEMAGYRCPFVRESDSGWEIVTSHVNPSRWRCSAGREGAGHLPVNRMLRSDTAFSRRAYSACEWLIARARDLCRNAGADLVVMTIPTVGDVKPETAAARALDSSYPDRQIDAICSRLGVAFVPLKPRLERTHYKPRDDHWTESGHARIAEVVNAVYRERIGAEPATAPCGVRAISG